MRQTLKVENLSVTSSKGRVLLDIPNLTVEQGQCVGVKGPSGAGKSTLLYAFAGLLEGAAGKVSWGETELLSLSPDKRGAFRSTYMGLIFQDYLLIEELSALANASLSSLYATPRIRKSLEFSAETHLTRLGITDLQRPVSSFSGGERQRVAVARALANNPPVLLADEPTASLHREAADSLTHDLIEIAKAETKTLIVVSHDLHLLEKMDRVISLVDGRIHEDNGVLT